MKKNIAIGVLVIIIGSLGFGCYTLKSNLQRCVDCSEALLDQIFIEKEDYFSDTLAEGNAYTEYMEILDFVYRHRGIKVKSLDWE